MDPLQRIGVDVDIVPVADFYAGKSVFVTGGTGFLGKVIIEKLLYSCPQLDKLYVLVREKRNLSVQQRIEKLIDLPVFKRLKDENPQQLKKIVPVSGDVVLLNLGIGSEDEANLLDTVSIVIHTVAIIKFNENLKIALNVNYEGTKKVLDLCRRMKKIQVFVYVSTAYTNTQNEVVEEKLYPTSIDVDDLYEKLNQSKCDESKLLYGHANTYVLTKYLAESLVMNYHGDVPTVVVKPSIVTASISDPVEGWTDSWTGATSILSSIGRGFCRVMMCRRDLILDVIPVDYVSNFIIVSAAKCHMSKEIEVFNCCSSSANPVTLRELSDIFIKETIQNGNNEIPFPSFLMTRSRWVYWIVVLFTEIIPAYFADFCFIQFGNRPKFIKIHNQLSSLRKTTDYFTLHSWVIKNDKARALAASLSSRDAALFPCDPSDICWPKYAVTYYNGVKRFLIGRK